MIEAINLTKRYEDNSLALDHLNLKIRSNQIYCLLGANGAGKTTTINIFFNFIAPTSGKAVVNGYDCTTEPLLAKKFMSYVSENVMLYGNFTARQNLEFFNQLSGNSISKKEDFYMTMRSVGLPEKSFDQKVSKFSKGMRQKLGIAIAIMKDTPALLLDEPTSGLDPKAAADFIELILNLKAEGKAILMSTHDIFRIKDIADTVGIMKNGILINELDKNTLLSEDLEKLYIKYMN